MCRQQQYTVLLVVHLVVLLLFQCNPAQASSQTGTDSKDSQLHDQLNRRISAAHQQETFKEEALVLPLHDGRTLVQLHFTQSSPHKQHFSAFPKAVGQLAAAVPFDEVELSLTQGRWQQQWGEPPVQPKPTGAELLAKFSAVIGPSEVRRLWARLSHALGGMFCASLNFVARPETTATQAITLTCSTHQPAASLQPNTSQQAPAAAAAAVSPCAADQAVGGASVQCSCGVLRPAAAGQHVLYAALPQEASCTENLTPWLKLLPCRDAAGVGRLVLQRNTVFGAAYHSMRVLLQVRRDSRLQPVSVVLTQTFTMVLQLNSSGTSSSSGSSSSGMCPTSAQLGAEVWDQLAGQGVPAACPVAQLSRLYVHLPACNTKAVDSNSSSSSRSGRSNLSAEYTLAASAHSSPGIASGTHGSDISHAPAESRHVAAPGKLSRDRSCLQPDAVSVLNLTGCDKWQLLALHQAHHHTALWQRSEDVLLIYNLASAAKKTCAAQDVAADHLGQPGPQAQPDADAQGAALAQPDPPAAVRPSSAPGQQAPGGGCLPIVTRDITGSGGLHGGMVLRVQLPAPAAAAAAAGHFGVCVLQVVPWQVRWWLHTLQLHIDDKASDMGAHLTHRYISTAADRSTPLTLHLCFSIPSSARSITLSVRFSKAFLTAFEHPPDAYRGFDVPAAQVSLTGMPCTAAAVRTTGSGMQAIEQVQVQARRMHTNVCNAGGQRPGCDAADETLDTGWGAAEPGVHDSPLLHAMEQLRLQVYSPGVVVPLAVPDFSMPYNVICLTSTVLAIFLGASLNTLLLRPAQAERDAYSGGGAAEAARRRKRLKLCIVMLMFGGLGVYLDPTLQDMLAHWFRRWGIMQP